MLSTLSTLLASVRVLTQPQGVANVAAIAKQTGAQVVLVSSMLVTPKNRWNPIRLLLNNIRWGLMDEKFNGARPGLADLQQQQHLQ